MPDHSPKKRKDSLETRAVLLIFSHRAYMETAKNGNFCEELRSGNGSEAVLADFCCYDHFAKAPEAVQKIATYQKQYRKCSLCFAE